MFSSVSEVLAESLGVPAPSKLERNVDDDSRIRQLRSNPRRHLITLELHGRKEHVVHVRIGVRKGCELEMSSG